MNTNYVDTKKSVVTSTEVPDTSIADYTDISDTTVVNDSRIAPARGVLFGVLLGGSIYLLVTGVVLSLIFG